MIAEKTEEALKNNGVLNREEYDIGVIGAMRFMNPEAPKQEEMLYGALVCIAYRIPLRPFDRIEHFFQLTEPYGPQVAYDRLVKDVLEKIAAENEVVNQLGPAYDNVSASGLILPGRQ